MPRQMIGAHLGRQLVPHPKLRVRRADVPPHLDQRVQVGVPIKPGVVRVVLLRQRRPPLDRCLRTDERDSSGLEVEGVRRTDRRVGLMAYGVPQTDELAVQRLELLSLRCGQILLAGQPLRTVADGRPGEEERVRTQPFLGRQFGVGGGFPRADRRHGDAGVGAERSRQNGLGQSLRLAQIPKSPGKSYGLWRRGHCHSRNGQPTTGVRDSATLHPSLLHSTDYTEVGSDNPPGLLFRGRFADSLRYLIHPELSLCPHRVATTPQLYRSTQHALYQLNPQAPKPPNGRTMRWSTALNLTRPR